MKVVHDGGLNGNPTNPTPPNGTTLYSPPRSYSFGTDAMTVLHQTIRIDINRHSHDTSDFPIKALIKDTLLELQKAAPTTMILPIDETSTAGALTMESDIPTTGDGLKKYFGGFQDAPGNTNKSTKVIRVFLRISSPQSIRDLKRNTSVFGWLKANNFFIRTHGFSTSYDVVSAGFISRMSPTLHRRDTVNNIIQAVLKAHHPDIEIHLALNRIPSGKGADKRYTTAVEVQVDRQHLQKARELMIEIFETKQDVLPKDIFFIPTPTNGTMPYELYYRNLHAHHEHIANLRSFAITNVGDLKAEMTFTDPSGKIAPRVTTFEAEIMREQKKGTTENLFYSIEMTKFTETEGRYLLVTHKNHISEAEQFIDYALQHLTTNCPDNMAKITRSHAPVTRTNRITTSDRFQSYVTKLQSMIPTTINMSAPTENAWKRRPSTAVNLTDDNFPALETPKKQRTDTATTPDTTTDSTESLTTIDLDEIEKTQNDIKEALHQEIATLREETQRMQTTLQEQFTTAMNNLELRIETSNQKMFQDLGHSLSKAVETMNAQAARADTLLQNFKDEATRQHTTLLQSISAQLAAMRPNKRERATKTWEEMEDMEETMNEDNEQQDSHHSSHIQLTGTHLWAHNSQQTEEPMDEEKADGSLNPNASRASHPKNGTDASTGGIN
jgi:hypothetical protein